MADEKQQTSAIFKRHEQLKRWEDSDTNKCSNHTLGKDKKVKFQDGCVFLAACSSGDTDEVKRLLERGADINTANIDGLTALHQACIDDNLDMVEFLVEHGADVDVCDNEGWTPLHATASCGFTEIARYLLRQNANVAAVNNDGDLPYDICEDETMEKLLQECMDEQGVDADAARREEEDMMMEDANQWLNSAQKGETVEELTHPKTGATALHVASAKGYVKVMAVLLQAGFDINAKDTDGWTPLHAAAHWGQEESCKILAENMCDMEAKNLAGQTAFDVADTELVKLLEELKLKQASLKDQQKDLQIIQTRIPSSRRSRNDPARSSVTRMSVEQKHNVMKNVDGQERATLDAKIPPTKEEEKAKSSSSSSCSEDEEEVESSESETEKKNEINKKTSQQNQPRDRDKPPIMTTVEIKEKQTPEMPKIEESVETTEKENIKFIDDENEEIKNDLKKETEVIGDGLKKDKIFNNDKKESHKKEKEALKQEKIDYALKDNLKPDKNEDTLKDNLKPEKIDDTLKDKEIMKNNKEEKKELDVNEEKKKDVDKDVEKIKDIEKVKEKDIDKEIPLIENVAPKKEREGLKRTASAPPKVTEVPKISINTKSLKDNNKGENEIPSWRLGLRKTGSTSMVPHDSSVNKPVEDDKNLPRSASSPRIGEEDENKKNEKNDKPLTRRPFLSSSSFSTADHNNSSVTERSQGLNPYRYSAGSGLNSTLSYQSSYIPYYRRQQLENERKERERSDKDKETSDKENLANNRISAPASLPVTSSAVTTASTISTASSSTTVTTPTSSFTNYRKSYEPPKRDEETEMLRKVRAKRARETRRSTQGVTLEEVQQANEVLRKSEQIDPSATTSFATTTTTTTSNLDRTKTSSDDRKSQDSTDSVNKDNKESLSSDRDLSSRLSADVSLRRTNSALDSDSSSLSSWRRSRDIDTSKKEDDTTSRSSSFRRSRVDRDLTSSYPSGSLYSTDTTYVPRNRSDRSERNALSVADIDNTSLGGSVNLTRSASLRTDRLLTSEDDSSRVDLRRNREKEKEKEQNKEDKVDKDDKRPESAAIRSRRMRRERRSTGIANYTPENKDDEDDRDKENKDDNNDEIKTEKSDTEDKSSRYNRYGSASDVPSHITSRPSSYSEYSRSTPALEKDYKKLYEDEKLEKERLKRELEQCKKELREAKLEIDRQMKKNEANRVSDTNDKRERRALERKLSELEEEVKKMDQLKEDNRRLREENGALIRVISKLSK